MHFCASCLANVSGGTAHGQPSLCLSTYLSCLGFAKSWEEGALCVTSLQGSAQLLSQKGICIPFKATPSPFRSLPWHPPWRGTTCSTILEQVESSFVWIRCLSPGMCYSSCWEVMLENPFLPLSCTQGLSCNSGIVISRSCSSS